MTVLLSTQKFNSVKGRFLQQNSIYDHLYLVKTKLRKVLPKVVRQIIYICIENAHLLILIISAVARVI